ncbi:MAG: hypothetical protein IPL79_13155 [Myxococcales bacterium]|nr:hypothetical protein [Myxococcales bacterium]
MKPLLTALQRLVEGNVEFIVVGGLACVIQGALQGGVAYDELMPHTVQIAVGGATCAILQLSEIIRLKQIEPRDKDNAQLPVLLATLRRLNDRDA